MNYGTCHRCGHPPDGRAAYVTLHPSGLIVFTYRRRLVHPRLVACMDDLSAEIAASGVLDYDPADGGEGIAAWLLRDDTLEGYPLRCHVRHNESMPLSFEVAVRADWIDPAVIREMNQYVLPSMTGLLTPVSVHQ